MTVLLLANVGLRDVLLDGQPVEPARAEGERVLASVDALASRLELPMLSAAVGELLRDHGKAQVVLYGTDQDADASATHRERDTIYLAQVAAKLLERGFSRGKLDRISVRTIPSNPSLYDDMLVFFQNQLRRGQRWLADVEWCYVFPVGGIPAANMGLTLGAIEGFGEACRVLYLAQGERRPVRMDLGEQIRRGVARRMAAERLQDLSFGSTVPLLQEAKAPLWAMDVARYAWDRYHFDFEEASRRLQSALEECSGDWSIREQCRRLQRSLTGLRDGDAPTLLGELYHNAALAYRRGEYAAFLGVLFRFQEAILRYMAEELYPGLFSDVSGGESALRLAECLAQRRSLADWLGRQKVNGSPLHTDRPSIELFTAMIRFTLEGGESLASPERASQMKAALESLGAVSRLKQLRNKSVIAHGFRGVSAEAIRREWERADVAGEPLDAMSASLDAIGISVGESPFQRAANLILEALG